MKISVIIPVYNAEKFLGKCVNSVMKSTFHNIECILVDDGSSDGSGQICDKLARTDSRIKVIHKKNGGVSSARNVGIRYASGEYITFVDSDDYIDHNIYQQCAETIEHENAQMVCFGMKFIERDKEKVIPFIDKGSQDNFIYYAQYMHSPCNKVVLKKLVTKNDITFDEDLIVCEDLVFCFQLFIKSVKTVYLDSIGYYYINNEDSSTHKMINQAFVDSHYKAYSLLKDYCIKENIFSDYKKFLKCRNLKATIYYLTRWELFSPSKYRELTQNFAVWTAPCRPIFFILTLFADVHFDIVPFIYTFMAKKYYKGH